MFNTFPILLSFSFFVPFNFRISIALFLIELFVVLKNKKLLSEYFEKNKHPFAKHLPYFFQIGVAVSALFIAVGLYTQITSLVVIYFLLTLNNINKKTKIFPQSESSFTYVLLISFSLLFLGAGVFAFDLPL